MNGIALESISKVYNDDLLKRRREVLKNITLNFPVGQTSVLLGHNGAGKSTAIRIILGLIRPSAGSVRINGEIVSSELRREIGYMPETDRLPTYASVLELLKTQLQFFRPELKKPDMHQRIGIALADAGLHLHAFKRIGELSKGMARRVAWAIATIADPQILILDEPFSGMDPPGREDMCKWLQGLRSRGKTLMICTHDLVSLGSYADRAVVLRAGTVVYQTENHLHVVGSDICSKCGSKKFPAWFDQEKVMQFLREDG